MKFNINQNDLQQSLGYCQGVIEKRSTLPILSNILLDATGSNLKIIATDLDLIFVNEIQNKFFLNNNYNTQVKSRSKVLTNEIIRFKGRIDYIIEQISGKKNKNFNKNLISILRLAIYEILFDPKIPDYASVNTAVDLTKINLNKKASGLTNAVLRNKNDIQRLTTMFLLFFMIYNPRSIKIFCSFS